MSKAHKIMEHVAAAMDHKPEHKSKFKKMEESLEKEGHSKESAQKIAAAQGMKVYGKKVMEKAAHAGVSAESMKKKMHK